MNEIILQIIHGSLEDKVIFGSLAVLAFVGLISTIRLVMGLVMAFIPWCEPA